MHILQVTALASTFDLGVGRLDALVEISNTAVVLQINVVNSFQLKYELIGSEASSRLRILPS